jgi:hypothetical protein
MSSSDVAIYYYWIPRSLCSLAMSASPSDDDQGAAISHFETSERSQASKNYI